MCHGAYHNVILNHNMKLYTATAIRPTGKKPLEHIEFLLDGTPEYRWREVNDDVKNLKQPLDIPTPLPFKSKDLKFEELNDYCWLRTVLTIPILNNKLIKHLSELYDYKFHQIPVTIENSKDASQLNTNFSAFYIHEYYDCIDFKNSEPINRNGVDYWEYNRSNFMDKENYPPLFRIKGISTPFMHFTTDNGISAINSLNLKGAEFKKTS